MRFTLKLLAGACAALCLSANLYAGSAADLVKADGAFARAVPPGQPNSAAFVTLTNTDDGDHALVAAETNAAEVVELHTHTMEDGMMKMRRVDKIGLPAGETVKLQPGGLHIMLIGLEHQLEPGEELAITLIFEDDGRAALTAPVKKVQHTMNHHHH